MESSRAPRSGSTSNATRATLLVLALVFLSTAWVHRRTLGSFFAPDDILHMGQALGLSPTPLVPWRFLSQVVYFRVMLERFGTEAAPFMAVNLLLHTVNAGLLLHVARREGYSRTAAAVGAILFGSCPLFVTVLHRAVTINELLALTFWLLTLLVVRSGRPMAGIFACALFVTGILCKEGIVAMPALLLFPAVGCSEQVPTKRIPARTVALLIISAVTVVIFFMLRSRGLSPAGAAYAVGLGAHILHTLATYLTWFVSVWNPLPDMVRSFDSGAWRIALPAIALLVLGGVVSARARRGVAYGLCAWLLGLLPVLLLVNSTYAHYSYVATAGLSLAFAAAIEGFIVSTVRPHLGPRRYRLGIAIAFAIGTLYVVRADALIATRMSLTVPNSDLLMDPLLRGIQVERNAVTTLRASIKPGTHSIVFFAPAGSDRTFGARTGREYHRATSPSYDLVEAVTDTGRVARIFFPGIERVAYIQHWDNQYLNWDVFIPVGAGSMWYAGTGQMGAKEIAAFMTQNRWSAPAREFLPSVLRAFPEDSELRFAYSLALLRTGGRDSAFAELREIARRVPDDSIGRRAKGILDAARDAGRTTE